MVFARPFIACPREMIPYFHRSGLAIGFGGVGGARHEFHAVFAVFPRRRPLSPPPRSTDSAAGAIADVACKRCFIRLKRAERQKIEP